MFVQSAISNQQSAISNQQSAISNNGRNFTFSAKGKPAQGRCKMKKSLLTVFSAIFIFAAAFLAVSCGGGGGGAIAAVGGNNKGKHFGSSGESGSKLEVTSSQLFEGETASMMATTPYEFVRLKVSVNGEEKTYQIKKSENIELNLGTTIGDKLQMQAEICDASGNVLRTAISDQITIGLGKNNVVMYVIYKAKLHHADGTVTEYPFTSLGSTLPADGTSYPTSGYVFNAWASGPSDGSYNGMNASGVFTNSIEPGTRNDVELYAYWEPFAGINTLSAPEFTFSPGLTGKTDSDGYQLIEIPAGQSTASCRISTNEAGASLSGTIDGTPFNGTYNGSLALGSHTISATISKENCLGTVITKKIKVVKELQKPTLKFISNSAGISDTGDAEDSNFSSYGCYNINLTAGGTGSLEYTVTPNAGDSVSVKVDSSAAGLSGNLALGPHTITLSVSRPNYVTKTFTEKVYVQGILSNPTITPTCTYSSGNDYQFSYLTYDKMPVSVSAGNTGNIVEVRVDGSTVAPDFELAPDASYTVTVKQSRQYCKTSALVTKTMNVKIKPVTLGIGKNTSGTYTINPSDFGAPSWDLKGQIYLNRKTVFSYESGKKGVTENRDNNITDYDYGEVFTLETTDATIAVSVENLRRNIGGGEDKHFCESEYNCGSKTLQQIKAAGWKLDTGKLSRNGKSIQLKFSFDYSE